MSQGVDEGVVTHSEFMIVQLASDEKLTKRTSNRIIQLVKRKKFRLFSPATPADIRSTKIQSIESAIAKADGGLHEFQFIQVVCIDQNCTKLFKIVCAIRNECRIGGRAIKTINSLKLTKRIYRFKVFSERIFFNLSNPNRDISKSKIKSWGCLISRGQLAYKGEEACKLLSMIVHDTLGSIAAESDGQRVSCLTNLRVTT